MRMIFMGTPEFAVPILEKLADGHDVAAVVTQPDRPKGRGRGVTFSPVKELALRLGIEVLQPEKVRDEEFIEKITALGASVFVVVAYGQILPPRILRIPSLGCVNIHASLLPKYRGAAPMQHVILNGETETGITIMYMDKGMDTGDMILKRTQPVGHTDRLTDLHDKMAALSCECITEALALIEAGTAPRVPQDHSEATYAPMLRKEDGKVDWHSPSEKIVNQVRALDPWPGTYSGALKIWVCEACADDSDAKPGEVIQSDSNLLVKTGSGALLITELQAQGSKRMKAADYLRGRPIPPGTILGGE